MSEEDSNPADTIAAVLAAIHAGHQAGIGPSFTELIEERIKTYAQLTNRLLQVDSEAIAWQLVDANPEASVLNEKIQHFIRLSERGLVEINPTDTIKDHVFNPIVRYIGEEGASRQLENYNQDRDKVSFPEIMQETINGIAAAQILGGVKFWIDPAVLDPDEYALVHKLSSTKH